MKVAKIRTALLMSGLITMAGVASAQVVLPGTASKQASANFTVSLKIKGTCKAFATNTGSADASTVAGADIAFNSGVAVASDAGDLTAPSTGGAKPAGVVVNCTKGTPFAIALTPTSTSSTDGTGNMKQGTETVAYSLYQPTISGDTATAATTKAWGNVTTGAGVNAVVLNGKGMAADKAWTLPVSAKVLGAAYQDVSAGTYYDTVTADLWY